MNATPTKPKRRRGDDNSNNERRLRLFLPVWLFNDEMLDK